MIMFLVLAKKCALVALLLIFSFLSLCHQFIGFSSTKPSVVLEAAPESSQTIPKQIWQFDPWDHKSINGDYLNSWISKSPGTSYTLMRMHQSEIFVRQNFQHEPILVNTYLQLQSPALKADLFRYMVLAAGGGYYSDLDTELIKPVNDWIPDGIKRRVRVIIGLEYDQQNDPRLLSGMHLPLQFCQWTMASSKGHPLLERMVRAVGQGLQDLAEEKEIPLEDLEPTQEEVLMTTGPVKWTQVVFDYLSERVGTRVTHLDLTGLQLPRLYGDILILPIDGFGTGVGHSNSSKRTNDATLIRHYFHSTWRSDIDEKRLAHIRPTARWSFPEVADRMQNVEEHLV